MGVRTRRRTDWGWEEVLFRNFGRRMRIWVTYIVFGRVRSVGDSFVDVKGRLGR